MATRGIMQDELEWSQNHKDNSAAKSFLTFAGLYMRYQDIQIYGLLCDARDDVREEMNKEKGAKE